MDDVDISFKTAKLAKEKGCNLEPITFYHTDSTKDCWGRYKDDHWGWQDWMIPCLTQSLLQRWLREVHGIHLIIGVGKLPESKNTFYTCTLIKYNRMNIGTIFDTFEEALEIGLQEGLKLIK